MPRTKRRYGLFEKQGDKWVRLFPELSFHKESAVKVFQNQLLAPYLSGLDGIYVKGIRELRPIKPSALD